MAPGVAVRAGDGRYRTDPGEARPRARPGFAGIVARAANAATAAGARRLSTPASGAAVAAFAPAKINLYLHVVGRRNDGYHLLDSLVAFADIGDEVTAARCDALSLTVDGPEAGALAGLADNNLVLRAANRLAAHHGIAPHAALHLDKRLPVASGIGGGSSDAAAALRALAVLWGLPLDAAVMEIAAGLGADVPVCLAGRTAWVGGIGERLEALPDLPPLGIVLANPRRELPTAAVFGARRGPVTPGEMPRTAVPDGATLIALLRETRNDLTTAALGLMPEIAALLDRLAGLPDAFLARMSGSGATCFALFPDRGAAERAAAILAAAEPGWWCAAGALLSVLPEVRPGASPNRARRRA
jgi:4-diphosphocytidyl-2-C-methyl-D-erythritol kinase